MLERPAIGHYTAAHMAEVRPLILIPSYNTGAILHDTVRGILAAGQDTWVIIDGSTDGSAASLTPLACARFKLIQLPQNCGKGAAILHGLRLAIATGYSHVLTIDADGQHPAEFIPRFLEQATAHPQAAIFGRPIFDDSAPAIRVGGRKISNFFAQLATLGWGIDDSLFGMRVYPAADLLAVMESTSSARRFDFDPETAVRLAWRGVPIINLPTPVCYPSKEAGGVSQFRYIRDNVLLTRMHLRLFCGFIIRLPLLLARGGNPLDHLNPPSA
jgi:glycosyltransferase involved in cell wall biosynthesis